MGFFEMIVAVVLISSVAEVFKTAARRSSGKELAVLLNEIRDLKEEIRRLRGQNNDVVLALDTTVHRLDRRISHLETRGLGAGEEREIRVG